MAPLPKRKRSKASQGSHLAHRHQHLASIGTCPQCNSPKAPHQVCHVCGTYSGRQVLAIPEAGE